jgi:hypothetical protein
MIEGGSCRDAASGMDSIARSTELTYFYIVFFESDVLEEIPITEHVIVIVLVSDFSEWVFDHIVIDIEFIDGEVDVEYDAHDRRNDAIARGWLKVDKLHYGRHRDIHQCHFVYLVHCGVDMRSVGLVPALSL